MVKSKSSRTKGGEAAAFTHHGADPYYQTNGAKPYDKVPWCIYFFYLGFDAQNNRIVRHYTYAKLGGEINNSEVPEIIRRLALNARKTNIDDQYPWPDGYDWRNIKLQRRSYVAILIDSPDIIFYPAGGGLSFTHELSGHPNYTFLDARELTVNVARQGEAPRNVPAVYCINHMKRDPAGNELDTSLYYHWTLNTRPELQRPFYPDSGPTNGGPPVPP